MNKKIRGIYRDALRFVINHKFLNKTIGNTRWFCHLVNIESKMIIWGE